MFAGLETLLRGIRRRVSHREWAARRHPAPVGSETSEEPGLLLIQIDGLSRAQLERALDNRRMPFLRRLLRHEGAKLHTLYAGLPATTAAVEAELYYGVRAAVPAFSFYDRGKRSHGIMCNPEWAKEVESACAAQAPGLLEGGSCWSNIYTGGASQEESHFCAASIGLNDLWRTGKIGHFFMSILFHPFSSLLLAGMLAVEFMVALWDFVLALHQGEKIIPELQLVLSRVFIAIGLREIVTVGAAVDVTRGLPIVHVNFIGYDEHAHRRGPDSKFAHWTLMGIDRAIRSLYQAADESQRRDYAVWIFSDHGQESVRSFDTEVAGGIEEVVRRALGPAHPQDPASPNRSQKRPLIPWWHTGSAAKRYIERWAAANQLTPGEENTFTVAGIGSLAHLYFARPLDDAQRSKLAKRLVSQGVPSVTLKLQDGSVRWFHTGGEVSVPDGVPAWLPHPEPMRVEIAKDLAALTCHPHSGDLLLLGWGPKSDCWTFAPEHGAHATLGPEETRGFVLLPPQVRLPAGTAHFIRPAALRAAALHFLGRTPLAAVKTVPVAGDTLALRVLTYNVHSCAGMDGRISPRRVARVIAARSPDLVALQELDLGRRRSRGENQAAIIADALEMHFVFCPTVTRGEEHYGHALLSRWPIEVVRRALLPVATRGWWREPRAALWARVVIGARRLNIITTHLGLGSAERRQQMQALMGPEWLGAVPADEELILCGDLNAMPGSQPYRLAAQRLSDAQVILKGHSPLRTFSSTRPFTRIDHIFASAGFVPEQIAVPRDRFTRVASDHLPLVVDFAIKPAKTETPNQKSA